MRRKLLILWCCVSYPVLSGIPAFCADPVPEPDVAEQASADQSAAAGQGVSDQIAVPDSSEPPAEAEAGASPEEAASQAPSAMPADPGHGHLGRYDRHGSNHGADGHDWPVRVRCEEGNSDCIAFRENVRSDPEAAAPPLLRYLEPMSPEDKRKFAGQNWKSISRVLRSLEDTDPAREAILQAIGGPPARSGRSGYSRDAYGVPGRSSEGGAFPPGRPGDRRGRGGYVSSEDAAGAGSVQAGVPKSAGGVPVQQPSPVPGGGLSDNGLYGEGALSDVSANPYRALMNVDRMLDSGDVRTAESTLGSVKSGYPGDPGVQSAVSQYYNDIARDYSDQRNFKMAARNYEQAEQSATSAIKLDPENTEAYKNRAMARMSLRDRKGAIEDVKKVMQMDPQDESAKMLAALVESKRNVTSLKSLALLQEMRGSAGGSGGRGSRAVAASSREAPLDRSSETRPAAPAPERELEQSRVRTADDVRSAGYSKTAASKNALEDYKSAVKYASMAIEKNPGNTGAYFERAFANNFLGKYDDVVRDTSEIIIREPSNVQALNMRALALNRKGLAKQAETDVSRAININPGFAEAWLNRALVYEKQGNYKQMLEDYRQAAVLNSAYRSRFQDAVAQYSGRVSGFSYEPVPVPGGNGNRSGLTRFLVLTGFTLTGGLLVALGLLHILTSSKEKALVVGGKTPYPDTLAPSIFYEGVASGKYKIERKLGEGGMGIVYEALDQSLGRKVAIKRMNEEIKVNAREKQRFLEEARTLAMLHHPNIVEIHTIFEEGEDIYLVCEHVNGMTLEKLLGNEVRLPFEKARTIFCEAAKALSYAHSKDVIHMDMKLSNIMISEDNEIKVMDFGLARHMKESLARISTTREVVGSPAYMPPEQDLGVSSKESDIYALGVCLYETLTGELPFKGPDFHYQKEKMLYRPAGDIVPGLPAAVDEFIAKTLSPAPENRFKTAADFRRALLDIV